MRNTQISSRTIYAVAETGTYPPAYTLSVDSAKHGQVADNVDLSYDNASQGPEIKGYVPLISWVQAGAWTTVEDPYEVGDAESWHACPVSHGHHTFILRVRGPSMEPEYPDGHWIFVDPSRAAENGSDVVVRLEDEGEATFKRLVKEGEKTYLQALNPSWPERIIQIDGNATIVGVVVFSGKPR